jgi:dihydroorotate dehydrogenase
MRLYERITLPILHSLEPEKAHDLSISALKSNLIPGPGKLTSDRLAINIAGLHFPNPIGLAAGYDKNAKIITQLMRMGFGFIEVGAVTPKSQNGNPNPRLFRLDEDLAIINRFGFNNLGMNNVNKRLASYSGDGIVGLNIGANKDSINRHNDYSEVLSHTYKSINFATINISSPNTKDLRNLQEKTSLSKLLKSLRDTRASIPKKIPLFLKVAPDLTKSDIKMMTDLVLQFDIDGIITTNTTLERENLRSKYKDEQGGLSGRPLFIKSTKILAQFSKETEGKVPLIGVGGISSARDVYTKIKAGASVTQLYSALVYDGFSLVEKIFKELDIMVKNDGYKNIKEAVGIEREKWM